jgi:hypothetical protein
MEAESLKVIQWMREESLSPLHVDGCAVNQLPTHLLRGFLLLQYLAVVN